MMAVKPNKRLDQFFLTNRLILEKEVSLAELDKNDIVLEVGAGPGNLTEIIASNSHVIAIERDRRFIPLLEKIENTKVICGDALRILKKKRLGKANLDFNKVISNIPYSISKKLIIELLKHKWDLAVLVVQKEFAQKLSREKFGLIMEECCELSMVGDIDSREFYPPAVTSSLIVLKQKKLLDENFLMFLDRIFRQKNKDVKNVVKAPNDLERKKVRHLRLDEIKRLM